MPRRSHVPIFETAVAWCRATLLDIASAVVRPFAGGIGCIICLHRVVRESERSDFPENRALEMTPRHLRMTIDWLLHRGLEPISLDAIPERLAHPQGRKFVCFTFDDGYRDNAERALPIFEKYRIPWAIHVTTGFANRTSPAWWYTLEDVLAGRDTLEFAWKEREHRFALTSVASKHAAFESIARMIRSETPAGARRLMESIASSAGIDPLARTRELFLNWTELRQIAANPLIAIGAHTINHPTLNLLDPDEACMEMAGAKVELEQQLQRPIRHMAFPFGGANAVGLREFELAAQCGFLTCATTRSANLFAEHSAHLHALPRIGISGNYDPLQRLPRLESGFETLRENERRRFIVE